MKTKQTATVRDATFALLRDLGMTTVFGNPGSTELAFLTDWPDDFRYILALQEACAVGMADGYARATQHAAFVNLHSAAGVGNALGNVFTAYKNQTPLVITAGQQARSLLLQDAYLAADRPSEFPRPYVKWSCEPARAQDVPAAIARAYHIATQPPYGPTFVSIPSDDWIAQTTYCRPHRVRRQGPADADALAQLVDALQASARPAIVAGSEIGVYGGYEQVVELAERLQAPVWTAPVSSSSCFPELHPLFAGFLPAIPGGLAQHLAGHDFVLVIGAPAFTFHMDGEFRHLLDNVPIFQLTVDADSAARAHSQQSLVGDLSSSLNLLLSQLPKHTRQGKDGPPTRTRERVSSAALLSAEYVLQTLYDLLPAGATIVEEAPSHRPALQRHVPIVRQHGFFTMASGGLGYGLPAAVGVALADQNQRVVAIIGDGSFMYSVQALWSAAQKGVTLTTIVLNNGGYGAMRSFSQLLGYRNVPGIDLPDIDYVGLATSQGVKAWRVETADALHNALGAALIAPYPTLLEIVVDPEQGRIY
jgi:benzoylformate decarboxylase